MTANIKELFDLSGRVAIVTGGSRGLGKEIAEGLAEAGASLMLCARLEQWLTPTVDEMRGRGFKVEGMICDVANQEPGCSASLTKQLRLTARWTS